MWTFTFLNQLVFRELSHLYINLTFRMLINMYILKSDENLPLQIMKNYSPPSFPPPRSSLHMYSNEFDFLWYYWRNSKCETFFDQHSYSLFWSAFSILVIRAPENRLGRLPSSGQYKRYFTVIRPLQRKRFKTTTVKRSFISQNLLEE